MANKNHFQQKTVAEKMGIKEGMRAFLLHAPEGFRQTVDLPAVEETKRLAGGFDYLHVFAQNQAVLRKEFPRLKRHLRKGGMLWVSWQKRGKGETDLTLPKVIEIGYDNGLVESKTLRIDEVWSAIKFTFPKAGKVYNNSYGKLKTVPPGA